MGTTEPDPFAIFHTPPPDEMPGERAAREAKEAEAKRVSDVIDDQLKAEKLALKKDKYVVRVLLLGQSESGKSTTLKNFRMRYAKAAWDAERASWRSVIQLNIIRSIITIVEVLQAEMDGEPIEPGTPTTPFSPLPQNTPLFALPCPESPALGTRRHSMSKQPLSSLLTDKHQLLKLRLGPLRRVETDLKRRLGEGAIEEVDGAAANLGALNLRLDLDSSSGSGLLVKKHKSEWGVHRLQEALEKGSSARVGSLHGHGSDNGSGEGGSDDATDIIASCREDMQALWSDEAVRVVLKTRKLRLEDSAGFFLDDLDRIAQRNYEPSDDDVVRARLRTLGVQEYRISFEPQNTAIFAGGVGGNAGKEWLLYDVGGSRTVRHAWLPYFDNVQAIIFRASLPVLRGFCDAFSPPSFLMNPPAVSCFDERLSEDSKINRLEDSFLLWRSICGSKLLSKATMILFLNKCDLLKKKLRSGIPVKKYLPSYGERPNDANAVVKYLREKFREILKQQSPEIRQSYFYATTVIDTKATAATIKAVKDSIIRDYLKNAEVV